ncbi:MAG TPA: class A beta-lactamase-related serine hydrolase [Gammaproteobacteria bacterium]|nr:class A beta-lactamase-related serine hydrolase [Gammaproteobacteria bacterium]HIK70838.1 class A beta-lactamase-related serine hydrolase [Pseudomonadales bacterium]
MLTRLILALILMFNISSCQSWEIQPTNTIEELENNLLRIFEDSGLSGISIVVTNDAKLLYNKSFGYANVLVKKPYTNTTVQNIGSVSKTFIAAAIMKAQELGKLKLDGPINKYLPFEVVHPKYPEAPITLRHLSQHTSGITDEVSYLRAYVLDQPNADYSHLPDDAQEYISIMKENERISYAEFLENVLRKNGKWYTAKNFTNKAPGKRYHYSNMGAALAALVIENATGQSFYEFTGQYIFNPLQMEKTSWELTDNSREDFAVRYFPDNIPVPDYHLITTADGGLITSTQDMGNYLIEILNGANGKGTILSQDSYKEMFKRTKLGSESSGIFWGVNEDGVLNHSGSDPGVLSILAIYPKRGVGIFIMTNDSADESKKLMVAIKQIWEALKKHNWK